MSDDDVGAGRYRFGPLERRGVVAGWRGGQIVAVAAGLVAAVAALRVSASVGGAAVAVVAVAVGVAVATWPLAGRSAEEWAPDAARHARAELARSRRRLAGPGAEITLLEVGTGAAQVGVVWDRRHGTYGAVLRVGASGFSLLGQEEQTERVARWSAVLASTARAGSALHRLQWIETALPPTAARARPVVDGGDDLGTDAGAEIGADAGVAAARVSYAALCRAEEEAAWRHEVVLVLTVHARKSGRAVRAAGSGHGGACAVLLHEVAALRRQLRQADLGTETVLDRAAVAALVRRASAADGAVPVAAGAWRWPWPMAVEAQWGRLRTDDTWHVTFWVAEWPRLDVGPDFLSPLVLSSQARRAVSVVMEPVGTLAAARRIEQARTADAADAELRRRGGFLTTARRTRERATLARREVELADGHAQLRFTGYVTVTASDPEALERDCGAVEQDAARCGIELRRCYGDQLRAFLCTLPLGRGLA
ncbi:MAG TPA: SCO6880 family protein [Acidimicrobiales bacterium]|nr:SCO6880 family protein [Acidimicrobiales bacterium]